MLLLPSPNARSVRDRYGVLGIQDILLDKGMRALRNLRLLPWKQLRQGPVDPMVEGKVRPAVDNLTGHMSLYRMVDRVRPSLKATRTTLSAFPNLGNVRGIVPVDVER